MTKYGIRFQTEDWYYLEVEADSEEQALDMFHNDPFTDAVCTEEGFLQENVLIDEVAA